MSRPQRDASSYYPRTMLSLTNASFVPGSTELTNIFKLSCVFLAVCSFLRGPQSTGKLPRTIAASRLCSCNNKARAPAEGEKDRRGCRLARGLLRDKCGSRLCPWLSDPQGGKFLLCLQDSCLMTGALAASLGSCSSQHSHGQSLFFQKVKSLDF